MDQQLGGSPAVHQFEREVLAAGFRFYSLSLKHVSVLLHPTFPLAHGMWQGLVGVSLHRKQPDISF
jgi:hypothetical protein